MLRRTLLRTLRRAAAAAAPAAPPPAVQLRRAAAPASTAAAAAALRHAPASLLPRAACAASASARAPCVAAARAFTSSAPASASASSTLSDVLSAELKHELEHYETPEARVLTWQRPPCARWRDVRGCMRVALTRARKCAASVARVCLCVCCGGAACEAGPAHAVRAVGGGGRQHGGARGCVAPAVWPL
jgi:hypothetical protein